MMKKLTVFASGLAVTCLTSLPAFAGPLNDLLGGLFSHHLISPPCGAPAPLLAAGIPAFIALGGGALLVKFFPQRDVPET
jgi:hypothetical protein